MEIVDRGAEEDDFGYTKKLQIKLKMVKLMKIVDREDNGACRNEDL